MSTPQQIFGRYLIEAMRQPGVPTLAELYDAFNAARDRTVSAGVREAELAHLRECVKAAAGIGNTVYQLASNTCATCGETIHPRREFIRPTVGGDAYCSADCLMRASRLRGVYA